MLLLNHRVICALLIFGLVCFGLPNFVETSDNATDDEYAWISSTQTVLTLSSLSVDNVVTETISIISGAVPGGTPGSGTQNDPYRIENITIDTGSDYGIEIIDTTDYILIKNVTVSAFELSIRIVNSVHTTIRNCTMTQPFVHSSFPTAGVYISGGGTSPISNNIVANSSFEGFDNGVSVSGSAYEIIANNTFINITNSLFVGAENLVIENNTMSGKGIVFDLSFQNLASFIHTIDGNMVNGDPVLYFLNQSNFIHDGTVGQVILVNSSNNEFTNLISDNGYPALGIYHSDQVLVHNSTFNGQGITVVTSHNTTITNNTFVSIPATNIWISGSNNSIIDNNFIEYTNPNRIYIVGGSANNISANFWSNHVFNSSDSDADGFLDDPIELHQFASDWKYDDTPRSVVLNNSLIFSNPFNSSITSSLSDSLVGSNVITWATTTDDTNITHPYYKLEFTLDGGQSWDILVNKTLERSLQWNTSDYGNSNEYQLRLTTFYLGIPISVTTEKFEILNLYPPSEPLNVAHVLYQTSVFIAWDAPADDGGAAIMGYKVYRTTNLTAGFNLLFETTDLIFADITVVKATTYHYAISAFNIEGESPVSLDFSITIPDTPSKPLGLTVVSNMETAILSWGVPISDGGSPITGYNVYRSENLDIGFFLVATVISTNFTENDVDLRTTYYYVITAVNIFGEGEPSTIIEIKVFEDAAPLPPIELSALFVNGTVLLSWMENPDERGPPITKFTVYRSNISGQGYHMLGDTSQLHFVDKLVQEGSIYYYVVTAWNIEGESIVSDEVVVTVPVAKGDESGSGLLIPLLVGTLAILVAIAIVYGRYKI